MASFDAGSIEARLELNRDAFRAGIEQAKAEGHSLEDQQFDANAGLRDDQLHAQIDKAKEELDRLKGDRSNVLIGADDAELERKIAEAEAKLDELKRKEREVGDTGREEFGKAAESLGKLRESADLVAGKMDEIKGRAVGALDAMKGKAEEAGGGMRKASRDTDTLGSSLLALGPKVDSALRGIPTLLAFGPLLAGAALPALAAVGGGILGMAGALTVAGVGMGAFGLASFAAFSQMKGDLAFIKQPLAAFIASQPGADEVAKWNALQSAISKLPPDLRFVAEAGSQVAHDFHDLGTALRPDLLNVALQFFMAAHELLPQLAAPAQQVAKAFGDWGHSLQTDFASPGFHAFMNFVTGNARMVLDQLGHSVGELAAGFGHLFMDTEPLMHDFLNGLVHITTAFNNWTQGKGQGQLQQFMDWVHQNGPQVKQTLEDLATAVGHIVRDLGGFAGLDLKILDDLAKAINAIAQAPGGAVALEIVALALALGKLAGIARLGTIITDLFRLKDAILAFRGAEGLMASIGAFARTISGNDAKKAAGDAEGGAVKAGEKGAADTAKTTGEAVGGGFLAGLLGKLKGGAGFIGAWMQLYVLEPIGAALTGIPGLIALAAAGIATGLAAIIAPIVAWGKHAGDVIRVAAQESLGAFGRFLGPIWGDIENAIGTGFGVLSRFFTQTVRRWMSTASRDFTGAVGAVGRFFSQTIPNAITGAAGAVGRAVSRYAEAIGNAFGHFGILVGQGAQIIGRFFSQTIPNAVTGAAGAVGRAVMRYVDAIGNAFSHFGSLVASAVGIIGRFFTDTLPNAISGAAGAVGRAAMTVVNAIGSGAQSAWGAVSSFFSGLPQKIIGFFNGAGSWLLGAGADIIHGIGSGASSAWGAVSSFFSSTIPSAIKGFFSDAASWLTSAGHAIIQGLGDAARGAWGGISSAFSGIKGFVTGFFSDAGSWLSAAGHAIVQGLADGINGAKGLVSSAVSGLKSLVGDVGHFLGIGSPSRLTTYWGRMFMAGLAQGITGSVGDVSSALSMVQRIIGGFSGMLGAVMGPQLSVGGARVGAPVTYVSRPTISVAGDLTREAVGPLLGGIAALQSRDSAVMSELAARGWHVNRLPGAA